MPKCLPKGRTGKGSPTQASLYPKYCVKYIHQTANSSGNQLLVERHGSGVALRTLDYENPGSNPGCGVKTLGKFFTLHCSSSLSCLNEYLTIVSGGYVYEQPSRINCSVWLDASQRSRDGV